MVLKEEQREALAAADDYLKRLIPGMEELVRELKSGRTKDTEKLMENCINGFNWIIAIFNQLSEVINTGEIKVNKEEFNPGIKALAQCLEKKEDARTANVIWEHIIPFLKLLSLAVNESLA